MQRCCRSCSSVAVQEATFAALQGHRDHKAVVCLAFSVGGAFEAAKGVLRVTGPSASDVVQRSSACAVLALLSALSPALQAASDSAVQIVYTISVALSNLRHYCLVVQACTTTAAKNTQSSLEDVVPHTPAQLVAPARVDPAGMGLTGKCRALDDQVLIQNVTDIAQQELLAMVRDVMRGTDELEHSAVALANALCACLAKFCESFNAAASKATATIIRTGESFAVLLFFICALVKSLKCRAGAEDLIRLLGTKPLVLLHPCCSSFSLVNVQPVNECSAFFFANFMFDLNFIIQKKCPAECHGALLAEHLAAVKISEHRHAVRLLSAQLDRYAPAAAVVKARGTECPKFAPLSAA